MLTLVPSVNAMVSEGAVEELMDKDKIVEHRAVLPDGFVYLSDIDPTIIQSVRYATNENFIGRPIDGYEAPIIILTKEAANRLNEVQQIIRKDGYSLVVYDGYRPQRAVNHFMRWSTDIGDQLNKRLFYPRVNKKDVFDLGYVAERSGHSRGSTVDLTLIPLGKNVHPVVVKPRTMADDSMLPFLDDGTLDFGSSFDLFDEASHFDSILVNPEHQLRRKYLKDTMEHMGFKSYPQEWWHFTLAKEPYSETYFDFPVK